MDNRTIEQVRENEDRLIKELQQKENIIKEVREYINRYETILGYYDSNYDGENDTYSHDNIKEELLEILDKGE